MTDKQLLDIIEAVKESAKPNPTIWDKTKTFISTATFAMTLAYLGLQLVQFNLHRQLDQNALMIFGLKKNSEVVEGSMQNFYRKQLEYIEHCKVQKTCNLPSHLAVADPLPAYVPISAIILQTEKK